MLFNVLCILIAVQVPSVPVLSEVPPALPQDVHIDNWLLTWSPAPEEGDVTYTVQYNSFDSDVWTNVPACGNISLNSCNVSSTKAKDEHGCVMLRVQAERRGVTSTPVKACSKHGDSCSPDFSLIAGSNSLTVQLNRDHSLAKDNGDHLQHRVYYGKKGEPWKKLPDAVSSVTIRELEEGQLYCAEVHYVKYRKPLGLATCAQCKLIPKSGKDSQSQIAVAVVPVVVILFILIPVVAYCLIFQHGTIKQWLRPPYQIPEDFLLQPFPENLPISSSSPTEEHYHVISSFSPEELSE
ncbi:interferon gamma receptor 2 [Cebidichthys violaceus]|uniref:interferon gamma receptor 2 n=1 Tax=Cebidichthys violaceus TaxID=271503 RepID=UPI0035C9C6D5